MAYGRGHNGQEGIHRAVAAKELGHREIPVKIYHSIEKGGNTTRSDKKEGREHLNKMKAEEAAEAKRKAQEEKEWQEYKARKAKERAEHPERYEKKEGQLDTSDVLGKGW